MNNSRTRSFTFFSRFQRRLVQQSQPCFTLRPWIVISYSNSRPRPSCPYSVSQKTGRFHTVIIYSNIYILFFSSGESVNPFVFISIEVDEIDLELFVLSQFYRKSVIPVWPCWRMSNRSMWTLSPRFQLSEIPVAILDSVLSSWLYLHILDICTIAVSKSPRLYPI